MAHRDFRHALDDIREAIAGIQAATLGKSFAEFENDWLLCHGVQRGIEIIATSTMPSRTGSSGAS